LDSQLPSSKSVFIPRNIWIGVVFFLLSMTQGLWMPSAVNILDAHGGLWVMDYTMAVVPVMAICSSLIFASLADRRYPAEKLMGTLAISGAVFLWLSFSCLDWGWSPWWYLFFQACNALISGPLWVLVTAGLLVSWLAWDASSVSGEAAAGVRLLAGLAALMMPRTPPVISAHKPTVREKLGLGALVLLESQKVKVYFVTTLLFTIPLAAFYMFAPKLLMELSVLDTSEFSQSVRSWLPGPSSQMTIGQMTEIGAMLLMSYLGVRARLRMLVNIAMVLALFRFTLFALAGEYSMLSLMWLGVALHGPIYTFFSITGQMFVDRRVPNEMRAQAQALLSLVTSLGNVMGPLAVGQLYRYTVAGETETMSWNTWPLFWWVLTVAVLICLIYFVFGYRDREGEE